MAKSSKAAPTVIENNEASVPALKEESNGLVLGGDFSDFDGQPTGLENVTTQDKVIPRLTILQALSPQLQRSKPEYNSLAKIGDICDTATGELFDHIYVVPCFFARVLLEWAPRERGGGFIANYGTDFSKAKEAKEDEKRRLILPNGNYLAETATWFVKNMMVGGRESFIPMTSTGLKQSRKWMTLITSERLKRRDGTEFQPPLFFRAWKLSPLLQSNAQGEWYSWSAEPGKPIVEIDPSKRLLNDCLEFYKQAREGLVRGDLESTAEEHGREMQNGAM